MHQVKCRCCGEYFDCDEIPYVMPSTNYYYHKSCYDNPQGQAEENAFWINQIYHYLRNTAQCEYDFHLCEAQRKSMIGKRQYTDKGIYFAIKYFHEIKHGEFKRDYGLGIVPHIYKDSRDYWYARERQQQNFMADLERTLRERAKKETMLIKVTSRKKKNKGKNIFADIEESNDD